MRLPREAMSVVLLAVSLRAMAQTSTANGDVVKRPPFPPHASYKNPAAVVQHYDEMLDLTDLKLGIASGNPLMLLLKPIVQLDFETTFNGPTPKTAPDSIVVTSRVFRLQVVKVEGPTAQPPAQPSTVMPQASTSLTAQQSAAPAMAPAGTGPVLNLLVASGGKAAAAPSWRSTVTSVFSNSSEVVRVDDTGIAFKGERWLSTVINVIDLRRQRNEMPLKLLTRGDSGRFSLSSLPERVQTILRGGLRLTITEDVHRLTIPVTALLYMASAPEAVKTRFGSLDFSIDGDNLDALRDFTSRLAPELQPE